MPCSGGCAQQLVGGAAPIAVWTTDLFCLTLVFLTQRDFGPSMIAFWGHCLARRIALRLGGGHPLRVDYQALRVAPQT